MTATDVAGPWAPVVYGRTRRADFWWRAVPAGLGHRGWLADVVPAAVAGGRLLERPRFLLSRSEDDRILIGVACRAAELSEDMNSHERRPLYCFVGWVAPAAVLAWGDTVPPGTVLARGDNPPDPPREGTSRGLSFSGGIPPGPPMAPDPHGPDLDGPIPPAGDMAWGDDPREPKGTFTPNQPPQGHREGNPTPSRAPSRGEARGALPPAASPPILDELRRHWREWAGPVYRTWVGRDWEEPPSRVREPRQSGPSPAPWIQANAADEPENPHLPPARERPHPLDVRSGWVWLVPGAEAGTLWRRGLATPRPYALVAGWAEARHARREGATHVCADDAALHIEAQRVTPPPAAPATPQPGRPGRPGQPAGRDPGAARRPAGGQRQSAREQPVRRDDKERHRGFNPVGAAGSVLGSAWDMVKALAGEPDDGGGAPGASTWQWPGPAAEGDHKTPGHGHHPPQPPTQPKPKPAGPAASGPGAAGPGAPEPGPTIAGLPPRPEPRPRPGPVPGRKAEIDPTDANYDDLFE